MIRSPSESVEEIEKAIPKLTKLEVLEIRDWIDNDLENDLELSDDVAAKLDGARSEISSMETLERDRFHESFGQFL